MVPPTLWCIKLSSFSLGELFGQLLALGRFSRWPNRVTLVREDRPVKPSNPFSHRCKFFFSPTIFSLKSFDQKLEIRVGKEFEASASTRSYQNLNIKLWSLEKLFSDTLPSSCQALFRIQETKQDFQQLLRLRPIVSWVNSRDKPCHEHITHYQALFSLLRIILPTLLDKELIKKDDPD